MNMVNTDFDKSDKQEYYWAQLYLACYNRNLDRVRQCYFALRAINKGIDKDTNLPIIQ